jgi:succinate dehydrogenase/fumarate reductase iron-sulfur protein
MEDIVRVRLFRYDPTSAEPARYDTYEVPRQFGSVVGDALEYIFENLDGSIAFRYECRTRQCGSCVVQVDDEPRLFCMEPIGERSDVRVEPLGLLPIVRDLVTDRGPLLEPLYELEPFADGGALPVVSAPRAMNLNDLGRVKLTEECAECCLCTAVCPAFNSSGFAGPMLFNKLARLALHEGDEHDRQSEAAALELEDCKTCFRCEEVCPHEIPIRQMSISRLLGTSLSYRSYPLTPTEAENA